MRKLVFAGVVLGLGCATAPAALAGDTAGSMSSGAVYGATGHQGGMGRPGGWSRPGMPSRPRGMWGNRVNGRWSAGWNAPGGWNAYRRPATGFVLPAYWINPSYYIGDYGAFGLPAPAVGYGWSRYYDDAVLTDRYGRVVDMRPGYDWDRYGGYDDSDAGYDADYAREERHDDRTGNTVAGAIVGGLIGGVAGNAIAGHGDKTFGTIVGAGVGAAAGGAIGSAASRPNHREGYADDYGYGYDGPAYAGDPRRFPPPPKPGRHKGKQRATYDGTWDGTWYGRDGSTYSGTYEGQYNGSVPRVGYYAQNGYSQDGYAQSGYGYVQQGYAIPGNYYMATTNYFDTAEPIVTETTVVTEETIYASAAKRVYKPRVHRARARPCSCSCYCR